MTSPRNWVINLSLISLAANAGLKDIRASSRTSSRLSNFSYSTLTSGRRGFTSVSQPQTNTTGHSLPFERCHDTSSTACSSATSGSGRWFPSLSCSTLSMSQAKKVLAPEPKKPPLANVSGFASTKDLASASNLNRSALCLRELGQLEASR